MMRLIEVIEGDETSEGPMQAATNFAQALRKTVVRCGGVPGFVNRILTAAMSEVWKATEEEELSIEDVDRVIKDSGATPMSPYFLSDLLGLDTVLHVAEHLHSESYGSERFRLGEDEGGSSRPATSARRPGKGFYEHG